ncbi:MAG: dihydropteroate synthase [Lachnospiraceae bacterium]
MLIGRKNLDLKNSAYICGILNVTPDSFSDGGKYNNLDAALYHAEEMIKDGAAMIDVGGESTRPGYTMISDEEEISRVAPVIHALKERFDVPVSLDTYKSGVAKAGIEAGADLINDIWGLMYNNSPDMGAIIAKSGIPCCLMHNRTEADYKDFLTDYLEDNKAIIRKAKQAGISDDKIILDPGVGFGKTYEHNLMSINTLEQLCALGYPVLLGTSRKSVVGLTLDLPKNERVEGTIATNVIGLMKGASIFRVHDVKENYRALKMAAAVIGIEFNK